MLQVDGAAAYATVLKKKAARFPDIKDRRYRPSPLKKSAFIVPDTAPRFQLTRDDRVFAIGSCFAREIEKVLLRIGCNSIVENFLATQPNLGHHLNEFTPASIYQRIAAAYGQFAYADDVGIEKRGNQWLDLCVRTGGEADSLERLHATRQEIEGLYQGLRTANVVVITLGLIESWYDTVHQCYLNYPPSFYEAKKQPDKYVFRRFDYEDALSFVDRTIGLLTGNGIERIILTVSPVALDTSFMADDTIVANSYSKAVLRCVAETIRARYPQVDYFPSYEVATSFGLSGTIDDNSHVIQFVVDQIMELMQATYFQGTDAPGVGA